jgi:hypothetical protein
MRLSSPRFEKAVRRKVQTEIRASPSLRKQYRLARRSHPRRHTSGVLAVWVILAGIITGIGITHIVVGSSIGTNSFLVVFTVFGTGLILLDAAFLRGGFPQWPASYILMHLPVSDEEICRLSWRKWILHSIKSALLILCAFVTWAIAWNIKIGGAAMQEQRLLIFYTAIAIVAAVVNWLTLLSTAVLLTFFCRGRLYGLIGGILLAASFFLAFFTASWSDTLGRIPAELWLVSPAGWAPFAFQHGALARHWPALLAFLPAAALAAALPWLGAAWRKKFGSLDDVPLPGVSCAEAQVEALVDAEVARRSEHDQALADHPELKPWVREEVRRAIPQGAEEWIRSRAFLNRTDWGRFGPIERLFGRWLNDRERDAAELALVNGADWSQRWKWMFFMVVAAALGPALLQNRSLWDLGAVVVVGASLFLAPILSGGWMVFRPGYSAGCYIPVVAVLPIGYWEMSRIILKAHTLRILAWAPLFAAYGAWAGANMGYGWGAGLGLALKFALVALALQPVLVAGRFLMGTADNERASLSGRWCSWGR